MYRRFRITQASDQLLRGSADMPIGLYQLHIATAEQLTRLLIAAALLKRSSANMSLHGFMHEQGLKRRPYKATWQEVGKTQTYTLIPDACLNFCVRLQGGQLEYRRVLLEHDRGSEEQRYFRWRIRAYLSLPKRLKPLSVGFTTFKGPQHLGQMREWTWQELHATQEPVGLGSLFRFASVGRPPDLCDVWVEPIWCTPYDEHEPRALLGEG
jgi:hypothetical protein